MKQSLLLLFSLTCCLQQTSAQTFIKDTDGNTKVETEATPNDDLVRISTNGLGRLNISGNAAGFTTIDVLNNNQSIYLGSGAGINSNVDGIQNIVIGHHAGLLMTSGFQNVFLGALSGKLTTTGSRNIAIGASTLFNSTTGDGNIAIGDLALTNLTTATSNTAVGRNAMLNNTIGNFNVAMGINAGDGSTFNVNCTYLGADADNAVAGSNLTNSTALGRSARVTASNQVRIGNNTVTSIGGFANWTNVSDGRVKKNVRENVPGLDFILRLRPVTYNLDMKDISRRLHTEADEPEAQKALTEKEKVLYSGFIAQEVEQAAKQLHFDFSGVDAPKNDEDLYGLRYAEFVVPMVKAIQEQQVQIEAQQAQIEALQSMVAQLLVQQGKVWPTVQVWPNPAGETVQISVTGATPGAQLSLYAADGKLLRSQPAQEGAQTIDLKYVAAGAYVLQLSVPGGQMVTNVVVKR